MVNNLAIISRLAVSVRRSDLVLPILGSDKSNVHLRRFSMGLTGADLGFFLGGGALVSWSNSTPINHIQGVPKVRFSNFMRYNF